MAPLLSRILLMACLAFAALLPGHAAATPSYDNCTGFLEPHPGDPFPEMQTITASGTWCLKQDLVIHFDLNGASLVAIGAHDVVVDCKGHRLALVGTGQLDGISSIGGARAQVRNCHLSGFATAISLYHSDYGPGGHLVEDNVLVRNRTGIVTDGGRVVIRRNRISGLTHHGIAAVGGGDVLDNRIEDLAGMYGGESAILIHNAQGSVVSGNQVRRLRRGPQASQPVIAVTVAGSSRPGVSIRDNVFLGDGPTQARFLECNSPASRYADNVVSGMDVLDIVCGDAGGNDIQP